ncbi:baseplate J/gp47 family protein [Chitiniphilus eburneus]|uniref:Baseplate J/gp47 family protein n=1 Tax=Chitiniphilus eburneus TaxID=2571148 RepID=A0A4U0QBP6_9NEIS|nr:baseplate J/gp47 family protein [Chitiniphilus eburneus]TJZ78797.1 baseplate J/gp47 family protein [Chitiniphilus eburneus]
MSLNRPTLPELVEAQLTEFEARLPGADTRLRHSNLNVLGRVQAGGLHQMYGYLSWLSLQVFPDTCETEFLDRWASIWLAEGRKPAALAQGSIRLTGAPGTIVPQGTPLARADNREYLTTADTTLGTGGTVDATVTAREAGASGNADTGTTLTVTNSIAGLNGNATVLAPGLTQGSDVEPDSALRQRLIARIQRPPQGGAASDYVAWALEVPGVTRAWTLDSPFGFGSIGVVFVRDGDADPIPDANEVAAVQAHIDSLRPVTAEFVAQAPTPKPVAYTIRLVPGTPAVRDAVIASLKDLHTREAAPGATLLRSHITEAISLASGEIDHTLVSPTADVTAEQLEMTVFGGVTWQ